MKMERDFLIECHKKGVLSLEGYKKLVNRLLNPKETELRKQLNDLLKEDHSCLRKDCLSRMKMKGHPVNCKDKICEDRIH